MLTPKADESTPVESGNTDVGNTDTEAGGAQPEVGNTETPTFTQADFEAETKRKTKENAARELEAEKARIAREAKEAKLLEDQKFEELANLNAEKAEAAERKLQQYEEGVKIETLLDKKTADFESLKSAI
jgi:tRNA 2-selenouridine synthase SelU